MFKLTDENISAKQLRPDGPNGRKGKPREHLADLHTAGAARTRRAASAADDRREDAAELQRLRPGRPGGRVHRRPLSHRDQPQSI